MRARVLRNLSTPEARAFWEHAERSAAIVATWPDWKRAGINEVHERHAPRTLRARGNGKGASTP